MISTYILNIPNSWDNIITSYDNNMIKNISLPKFYSFYNVKNDFKNVYEPSDDTFLLVDSLMVEINSLHFVRNSMEMG